MISAQTLRVCREGKPVPTLGSWPEGMLFRIMLWSPVSMESKRGLIQHENLTRLPLLAFPAWRLADAGPSRP
jgi:hypothetical protein